MAATYFAEKGVNRIVYAEPLKGAFVDMGYCRGFFETGREAGLETSLYVSGLEGGNQTLKKIYKPLADTCRSLPDFNRMVQAIQKESPTPFGLFIPTYTGMAMATTSLIAQGMRINKDVYTLSRVSSTNAIERLDPMPAIIHMHQKEVARRALQQLLYRIEHPQGPFTRLGVAPELIRPGEIDSFLTHD
jgi:DNA-binding LacI/PurR family transcriptional regulator